jgi:penicillin-binding protein 2
MITEDFGSAKRKNILLTLLSVGFFLLVGRLYQLQYIYRSEFGKKSEENSIRQVMKDPVRGYIFDRNGRMLVDNRPSYSVMLTPMDFNMKNIPLLAQILDMPPDVLADKIKKAREYSVFTPTRLKRDVDFKTLSTLEEYKSSFPGVQIQIDSKRFYDSPAHATHLLGYAKEISESQLEKLGSYYQPGDVVGATGIEAVYEEYLRGEKGVQYISQNAKGQIIGSFDNGKNDILPKDGFDLHLAIDADVQALAESLLTGRRGAVVAVDPNDGGVIALVSEPDYDLSLFSGVTSPEVWKSLSDDESKPLFDRATLTRYPPGSTFKMVLAAAGLETGIIDQNYTIQCHGFFRFGNRIFKDEHVHGSVNVVDAIQKSCNVFFYQLMLKVGLDTWADYAKKFGFGEPTGIDILEENPGLIPTTKYYDETYGKGKWTEGYLVSLGIGQGEIGVTPLQMADYTAMLANKGHFHQPHVVETIYNKWTNTFDTVRYKSRDVHFSEKTWDIIREGMRRVVMEPGGTGPGARIPGVVVAGKTGTAENPHGKAHAWFIGFAPFDHPKIAICVLLENAGYGGTYAAPIAGLCMEQYLFGKIIRTTRPEAPADAEPVALRKDTSDVRIRAVAQRANQ